MQGERGLPVGSTPDGEGGCECWIGEDARRRVYSGKALELLFNVRPLQEWSGFLSFHGHDAEDHERYSRKAFVVERRADER